MTACRRPPKARRIALLAALVVIACQSIEAAASGLIGERLLVFSALPESLRGVADGAFADVDDGPGIAKPDLRRFKSAEFDLNQDCSPELLLIQEDGKGCTGNTCLIRVMLHEGQGWLRVGSFLGGLDNVHVFGRTDEGFHRLANHAIAEIDKTEGFHTLQVWWRDRYWDLAVLSDMAETWPAERLHFRRLTRPERRALSRRIWPKDPQSSAAERQNDRTMRLRIARIDLNDDRQDELILVATDPGWCGSAGCASQIVQRIGDRWMVVGEINLDTRDYARVLQTRHNGYRMLLYTGLIVWAGNEYHQYGDLRDPQGF